MNLSIFKSELHSIQGLIISPPSNVNNVFQMEMNSYEGLIFERFNAHMIESFRIMLHCKDDEPLLIQSKFTDSISQKIYETTLRRYCLSNIKLFLFY